MYDKNYANELRRTANVYETIADEWLKFAKNKAHPKNSRITAARRYRANMKLAQECRERAKKYE